MYRGVPIRAPALCRGANVNAQLDTLEISATKVVLIVLNYLILCKYELTYCVF